MSLRNAWQLSVRRFGAGIDLNAQGVRCAVLSRRLRTTGPVRIEWLGAWPLAPGAVAGAEILDRAAVSTVLRAAFAQMPAWCAAQAMRCAMAIPASATFSASMPMAQLAVSGEQDTGFLPTGPAWTAFEPAVLAEAERVAGLERDALAVDWFVDESLHHVADGGPGGHYVTIAAASRHHLESRLECAAAAGFTLHTLDGEPHAALRAMRHAAKVELQPYEPYAALWVGGDGVYGWRVVDGLVACEIRYPALEYPDFVDALRELSKGAAVRCALLSGDLQLLVGAGFSLADVGDVLGCPVLPFECAALADGTRPLAPELLHEPACAVAVGLALRGVME